MRHGGLNLSSLRLLFIFPSFRNSSNTCCRCLLRLDVTILAQINCPWLACSDHRRWELLDCRISSPWCDLRSHSHCLVCRSVNIIIIYHIKFLIPELHFQIWTQVHTPIGRHSRPNRMVIGRFCEWCCWIVRVSIFMRNHLRDSLFRNSNVLGRDRFWLYQRIDWNTFNCYG